ncbi:MAG: GspH/FimT family pseudopilin [Candidatus Rokubacteria bacterium]|nr:GspH/FimT family pseudopilin [Candidatus Rokubacteria bacterium]
MRPASRGGFTLLELLVVLAILVVSAALVLPSLGPGTATLRLRAEARSIVALLRQARQLAVSQRRPHTVAIDSLGHAVVIRGDDAGSPVSRLPLTGEVRLKAEEGEPSLTFTPRGTARETTWLLEGAGGRRYRIHVEAVTGRVSLRREA